MSWEATALIVGAYLLGSIPTAYLVGRWRKGFDLRRYGTGTLGASNVAVHVGKWAAVLTGAFDGLAKGAALVILARALGQGPWVQGLVGLAAVAGHNWSPYLRFSGGRGLGTGLGVLIALAPWQFAFLLVSVVVGRIVFHQTALWTFIGIALLPLTSLLLSEPTGTVLFAAGFLIFTALKRLTANRVKGVKAEDLKAILLYRLLYDRPVAGYEDWIHRKPEGPQGKPDG